MSLTQSQIEKKLSNENLDELLDLWQTEQGAEKRRDLDLMAAAIPFSKDATLRVLDLCCGPGDVGRAVRARYPKSQIDCLDRDLFLISICVSTNRREGVSCVWRITNFPRESAIRHTQEVECPVRTTRNRIRTRHRSSRRS